MNTERCPDCEYYIENEVWYCDRTCEHPACEPCWHERWAAAHPLEAAREWAEEAEAAAQRAEEAGWEDWRDYAETAEAAWREVDRLEDEAAAQDADGKENGD